MLVKWGHYRERVFRELSEEEIVKIAKTFEDFQNGILKDEKGFCAVASIDEIAKQNFILTPGRFVGIEEQEDDGEPFDEKMARLTAELSKMFKHSRDLEDTIRERLGAIGFDI